MYVADIDKYSPYTQTVHIPVQKQVLTEDNVLLRLHMFTCSFDSRISHTSLFM